MSHETELYTNSTSLTTHKSCSHAVNEQAFVDQPLCRKTSLEFATGFLSDMKVVARRSYLANFSEVFVKLLREII